MIAAHGAGIPVFVTGGIGGVHRDGENTLDISADLTELGRTPIAVVSAGVKSILDIGRTLEFLETQGVCVATYGRSKKFPAFFSPESGYASPYNVCSPEEAAELVASTLSLGLRSGVLLAVPIPDGHSAGGLQIEEAIQRAVREASSNGIIGRDVTPFILQRVSEITEGKSLQANIALIRNNAKVGSQVACALSALSQKKHARPRRTNPEGESPTKHQSNVVVGGVNVDFIAKAKTENLDIGLEAMGFQSLCSVMLTDCLSRLDQTPLFISAIGLDAHGENVLTSCKHMNTSAIARLKEQRTATYCAVITEKGELSLGLGDMDIHQQIKAECVSQYEDQLAAASLVCVDGNVPVSTIDYICFVAEKFAVPVWFEPTDADKACKPFLSQSWKALTYTSPNLTELCTMNRALGLPTPAGLRLVLLAAVRLKQR
uniref:Carbohydrate kinase PfkB domain-containing protein n=1 Tax=Denticeps clupeoides TaxID=299321 RepID=A0AAY4C199_9TELE